MKDNQYYLFNPEQGSNSWFKEISQSLGFVERSGWQDQFGKNIFAWSKKQKQYPIRTLSLFSGGGGLDIAFHDVGFNIVEMVEIDDRYVETLQRNSGKGKYFNNSKPICIDIRNYDPEFDIPIDFIIGGPPCQTFSAAGRRAAGVNGTTDERGKLFWEYVRLIKKLTPKGFLFENVYGITGARDGKDWQLIVNAFKESGYEIYYRILDAADYGVPQHRERLIIVGLKNGEFKFPKPTHGPDSPGKHAHFSAYEAISDLKTDEDVPFLEVKGRYGHLLKEIPPGLNYSFFTEKMGHPNPIFAWRSKFSDFLYKADPERPVRTIKAKGGQYTGPFHWESRRFTIKELKRLQTFPDNYIISGSMQTQIEQIGNSVPPQFGRMLAISVLSQVFNWELPFTLHTLKPNEELGFRKRNRETNDLYREKAQKALAEIKKPCVLKAMGREYKATLQEGFSITELSKEDQNGMFISFIPQEDMWEIKVMKQMEKVNPSGYMEIIVTPKKSYRWNLGVNYVRLSSQIINGKVFTTLWKAFEAELVRGHYKADLVQLNAYYQYTPQLKISMEVDLSMNGNFHVMWNVVQSVVSGKGIKYVFKENELADIWEVDNQDILQYVIFLRNLGYEVRNWNTNPQIPQGSYLIPYAFPTLNPLSVQLNKSLT